MLLAAVLLAPSVATAGGFPAPEQALREAFPKATFEKKTWALSEVDVARVREAAGSAPESRLLAGWVMTRDGAPAGIAFLEAHEVRSKRETLLVSLSPGLEVLRVDVLAFAEPQEYLPSPRWLAQFGGKKLGPQLELKREIRGITGATLTSRAVTAATRRSLAIAALLRERGAIPAAASQPRPPSP